MPEETTTPSATNNNNNTKMIIIIVAVAFVAFLITIIIAGGMIISSVKNINPNAAQVHTTKEEHSKGKHGSEGAVLSLGEEMIMNINAADQRIHYVKMKISLEITPEKAEEEAKKRVPEFRDLIIGIVTTKTLEKIIQKEGKDTIRREIISHANKIFTTGKVENVFFEDFLVQ